MSRTIRRKGWHVVNSNKWTAQNDNIFYYVKTYRGYEWTNAQRLKYVERSIKKNMEMPEESKRLAAERHRDSFWKTLRWMRYASPIPRNMHKMAIKESLRNDTDYKWDEKAARKYEKGLCQMLWD